MGYKTRNSYGAGGCITERECLNRGQLCEKCIRKDLYKPKEGVVKDENSEGEGSKKGSE